MLILASGPPELLAVMSGSWLNGVQPREPLKVGGELRDPRGAWGQLIRTGVLVPMHTGSRVRCAQLPDFLFQIAVHFAMIRHRYYCNAICTLFPQLSKGSDLDSDLVLHLRDASGNPYYHHNNNNQQQQPQGAGNEQEQQQDPTIAGPSAGAAAAAAVGPRVVLRCRAVEVDQAGRVAEAAAGVRAPVSGYPGTVTSCCRGGVAGHVVFCLRALACGAAIGD